MSPGSLTRRRTFAFAFVCHHGDLEPKALLLAASLRGRVPGGSDVFAVVPTPSDVWGSPGHHTVDLLERLGVQLTWVRAPFGRERSHANKIAALRAPAVADRLVVLDTDILALEPFRDLPIFDAAVALKPADAPTWTRDAAMWERTFAAAGARVPSERVLTTVTGDVCPPYFNSGVLVVRDPVALAQEWERAARRLIAADLPFGPIWSDQPALAVALHTSRMSVGLLDETLNFPAHLRPVTAGEGVTLCHYHRPAVARRNSALRHEVLRLASELPPLRSYLQALPEWHWAAAILPSRRRRKVMTQAIELDEIVQTLRDQVEPLLLSAGEPATLDPEYDLLRGGLIDSMGIMEIVAFIDEEFGVDVDDVDIVPENFSSIGDMARYVASKRGIAAPEARPVEALRELIEDHTPAGSVVLVVSRGDEKLVSLADRVGWHFPRDPSGEYAGFHPSDTEEAAGALESLRREGATHIAFPSSELWWLEYYDGLPQRLGPELGRSDGGVLYSLG